MPARRPQLTQQILAIVQQIGRPMRELLAEKSSLSSWAQWILEEPELRDSTPLPADPAELKVESEEDDGSA